MSSIRVVWLGLLACWLAGCVMVTPPAASPRAPEVRVEAAHAVVWSPDGAALAIATDAGIALYDAATLVERRLLAIPGGSRALAFSADGRWLAAGTVSNTVQLWNAQTWQMARTLADPGVSPFPPADGALNDVAFSPDSRLVAASLTAYYEGGQGSVWLWDAATGTRQAVLGTYGPAGPLAFTADGRRLAVATLVNSCGRGGGGVTLWDVTSGEVAATLTADGNAVTAFTLHPALPSLAAVSQSDAHGRCIGPTTVHLWDMERAGAGSPLADSDAATSVAFSSDGRWLLVGDEAGRVHIWHTQPWRVEQTLAGQGSRIAHLAFHPDGQRFVAADDSGIVRLWLLP